MVKTNEEDDNDRKKTTKYSKQASWQVDKQLVKNVNEFFRFCHRLFRMINGGSDGAQPKWTNGPISAWRVFFLATN